MGHCGRRPEAVLRSTHRACSRAGTRLRQCGPHAMHAAQPESPAINQARHRSPSPALKTDMHTRSHMRTRTREIPTMNARVHCTTASSTQPLPQLSQCSSAWRRAEFYAPPHARGAANCFFFHYSLTALRHVGISADVTHVAASTERVVRDDQLVIRVVVRAVPPQHTCEECGPPSAKLWPPNRSTAR